MLIVINGGHASSNGAERAPAGYLGVRYTLRGAAQLLRVPPTTLSRWANGYSFITSYGKVVPRKGILQSDRDEPTLFNFPELIELLYVRELLRPSEDKRTEKRKLADLATISENLAGNLGVYPLARSNFQTAGSTLFTGQVEPSLLTDPLTMQHMLEFAKDFAKDLEFDPETLIADLWHPDRNNPMVSISPKLRFGKPTVPSGFSTDVIYKRYRADGEDLEETADWFDIAIEEVEAAVKFEVEWAA